jgi:hypothetical protein
MKTMNKTRKTPTHKLAIRTETLRALDRSDLARAGGAMKNASDGWVCETLSHGLSCWGACSTRMWC